jgi:predicted PurR-regulated permease PerM
MEIDEKQTRKFFIFVIIGILLFLSFLVLKPILISSVMGLIMAFIFFPVYSWINKFVKFRGISSLIVCFLFLSIIIIPLWLVLPLAIRQVFDLFNTLQKLDLVSILGKLAPSLVSSPEVSATITTNFNNLISGLTSTVLNGFSQYLLKSPEIFLNIFIFIFVFYFGLKDGESFINYIKAVSPFRSEYEDKILKQFKDVTYSVVYGDIIAGIVQGLITGIGLIAVGIPNALVLTILAIILSMLPVVGAYFVWIPAVIYLLVSGRTFEAIGLTLYGAIVISWIDNVVRSLIVSKKTNINSGIVLISMFGGLMVFGFFGIFIGPLIIAYLILLLDIYKDKKLKIS